MIKKIVITIIVLLAVVGLAGPAAAADNAGVIYGQVVNGTPGGGSVAGLEVTLVTYVSGQPQDQTASTQTDNSGNFTFSGLNTGQEYGYAAVVSYNGVTYLSLTSTGGLPSFTANQTSLNITLPIYESTRDDSHVSLIVAHMVILEQNGLVGVSEYYIFGNSDNRTYMGKEGDPGVLRFSLPTGAYALQINYGPGQSQVVKVDNMFWDARPMPPGGSEVGYTYSVNLTSGKFNLNRPIDYLTPQLDVLVPQGGLNISSSQLTNEGPVTVSGTVFTHYTDKDLAAGQTLKLQISTTTAGGGGLISLKWVLIGAGVVIIAFAAFYLLRLRKKPVPVPREGGVARQQQLLAELASIDDKFDAGDMDEDTYRKQRDAKKAELARLIKSQRGK